MSGASRARWGAASLFVAPVVVLVSFLMHPHIGTRVGEPGLYEAIAAEVAADPWLWVASHLLLAVGSGLLALAFIALRGHLREAGEDRWSAVGLPFVVLGSVFFALLPAMEMAPVAAFQAGLGPEEVAAVQAALDAAIFPAVLMTGSLVFGIGAVAFAVGTYKSGVLSRQAGGIVAGALVVVALSRFVPVFPVLFYVQSTALIVALWPLGYTIWQGAREPSEEPGRASVSA